MLLTACNHDNRQIRATAQGYLDAVGNFKPTEARPYCTQEMCDTTITFFEMLMEHSDSSAYANNIPAKITLGDIEKEDSLAIVYYHKSTPSVEQDGQLHLVKRKHQWLVHEIIYVPPIVRTMMDTNASPRHFTPEEIEGMRKNGPQHAKKIQPKKLTIDGQDEQ